MPELAATPLFGFGQPCFMFEALVHVYFLNKNPTIKTVWPQFDTRISSLGKFISVIPATRSVQRVVSAAEHGEMDPLNDACRRYLLVCFRSFLKCMQSSGTNKSSAILAPGGIPKDTIR